MGRLGYSINITLDGNANHEEGVPDSETHRYATETIARADALVFGRITYGLMEGGWRAPAETGVQPDWMEDWMMSFATTIHAARKYVVTDSMPSADWNNTEIIRNKDLIATVERLKREHDYVLTGGVAVPLALAKHGLIDEFEFVIHPRISGKGPTLLAGLAERIDLRLIGKHQFQSGCFALKYELKR